MSLFIKSWGSPNSPALVFLHGFLGTHEDFLPLVHYLKEDYYCVALDFPGHGASKGTPFNSYRCFEQQLLGALSSLKLSNWTLVGYSMGGRMALRLYEQLSFNRLILISSKVEPLSEKDKIQRELWDQKLSQKLEKESFCNFLSNWYSQPLFKTFTPDLLNQVIAKRKKEKPQLLGRVLKYLSPAHLPHPSLFLSQYSSPLLYIYGSHDFKYSQEATKVRNRFKQAWIVEESRSSHAPHLEHPKSVAHYINIFNRYNYDRMERNASV